MSTQRQISAPEWRFAPKCCTGSLVETFLFDLCFRQHHNFFWNQVVFFWKIFSNTFFYILLPPVYRLKNILFSGCYVISPLPARGADCGPTDHRSYHQTMSFPDGPLDTQSHSVPSPSQTKHPAHGCNRPGIDSTGHRPQDPNHKQHRHTADQTLPTKAVSH